MAPICVLQVAPPRTEVSQIDRMIWRREHQRAGIKHVRQRTWIAFWLGWNFGKGDVPGGADEFFELAVGHWGFVTTEITDGGAMNRRLFGIMSIRSHRERAAGNENHRASRTLEFHRAVNHRKRAFLRSIKYRSKRPTKL